MDKIKWNSGGIIVKNKASAMAKAKKERGHTMDGRRIHSKVVKHSGGYMVVVGFSKGYKGK
jgi:hypothetical protein